MATAKPPRSKRLPPLENGDRLDQPTFHARYEAMPEDCRAELIGGIVHMPSPQKMPHSETQFLRCHRPGVLAALKRGLASPERAAFAAKLKFYYPRSHAERGNEDSRTKHPMQFFRASACALGACR